MTDNLLKGKSAAAGRENVFTYSFRRLFWNIHSLTWDEYLDTTAYAAEIETIAEITRSHQAGANSSVLDIGCATGNYSIALARKAFQVTALDYAASMLKRAEQKARALGIGDISFFLADFNNGLDFPSAHFNFIIAAHIFQGIQDNSAFIGEIQRILKPGGYLFIVAKKKKFRRKSARKKSKSFLGFILNLMKPFLFSGYRKRSFDIEAFQEQIITAGFTIFQKSETSHNHIIVFRKNA